MKKICLFVIGLVLLLGCAQTPATQETPEPAISGSSAKIYGDGVTLDEMTEISEILAAPEKYIGKGVAVKGKITEVCPKMGCWMEIESNSSAKIRIKVEDGVIVFPTEAVGHEAVAEGEVEKLVMTREEYVAWFKHMAEEKGETFDESTVGEPPYEIIRINGRGAKITEGS
jgi:hypothetical protein